MIEIVTLNLEKGTITKRVRPSKIELEIKMTEKGRELGETSGLFLVPKIVKIDLKQGWIEFEFIQGVLPLSHFLADKQRFIYLVEEAGKCLAVLHSGLLLGQEDIFPLPIEIQWNGSNSTPCFLHGDFNLQNVQLDPTSNKLVIFDWSLSPLFKSTANWGTSYWDMAWMINAIFVTPPYPLTWSLAFRNLAADTFFHSYEKHSKSPVDWIDFSEYCAQIYKVARENARARLNWRTYLHQIPYRYCLLLYSKRIHTRAMSRS